MHTIILKKVMLPGKVQSTGNNVGGLVGYMYAYNMTNNSYYHNTYVIVENSFATRRSFRDSKCRRISTDMVIDKQHIIMLLIKMPIYK
ncbi:hypothetical protein D3C72_2311580 [compost metagenome]